MDFGENKLNPRYRIQKVTSEDSKSQICEKVLRSLPDWFGIESAILAYIKDVREMETWTVANEDETIGFLSVKRHNSSTAEIHVMGILPSFHGKNIGTKLIQTVEQDLSAQGFKFLTVKTLSESRPNREYDLTRKFYLRAGFTPLEEFKTLWGEANPCLMLVKALPSKPGTFDFGQIHHIEYYVNDLKRSNEFWDWFMPLMGYSKSSEWDDGVSWTHSNGTYLVFVQVTDIFLNAQNTRQGNGLNHIAFMGGSVSELDQLQNGLESQTIKILKRDGSYLCFEDPNQFAVEVYANMDMLT